MAKRKWRKLASMALVGMGFVGSVSAAPTVPDILRFTPRQIGVECTTPNLEQQKTCKVELYKGKTQGSGWEARNEDGRLRLFFDSDNNRKIDIWSYYKDGVEVYREVDTTGDGTPDQYRWLNTGGQKWGVDQNKDGQIDGWRAISPQEVSQEILLAISTRNFNRLRALMLTETEVSSLDLLDTEKKRITKSLSEAQETFTATLTKLKDVQKANWLHLETEAPHCRPADVESGSKVDLVYYPSGSILYDVAGKNDWVQTGWMVKVGEAWKLIAAPIPGHSVDESENLTVGAPSPQSEKLQELVKELSEWDQKSPGMGATPGPKPEVVEHHLKRADILEKIIAAVEAREREPWIRQVADTLGTAAQNSSAAEKTAIRRLKSLEDQIVSAMPGANLAAYVTFRHMQANYAGQLTDPKADFAKVQDEWLKKLATFVDAYPRSPDTADALLQLGMVSEFMAKEADAKKWYTRLVGDFKDHPLNPKAQGALTRLDLEGKKLDLNGKKLDGGTFDMSAVKGSVTVVYYWASWNQQCIGDFAKLQMLLKTYADQGLKLVAVNLDSSADEAKSFVAKSSAPGIHLYEEGGLENKYAIDHGIMVLPNLFLVDAEGKVISRTVQMGTLEGELKKVYAPAKK